MSKKSIADPLNLKKSLLPNLKLESGKSYKLSKITANSDLVKLVGVSKELKDPFRLVGVSKELKDPFRLAGVSKELKDPFRLKEIIGKSPLAEFSKISKQFAELGKLYKPIPELSVKSIPTFPSLNFPNIIIPRPVDSILPLIPDIRRTPPPNTDSATITDEVPDKKRIFIGHGHSDCWKELRDFVTTELRLFYDEFNRSQTAGLPISKRLEQMLEEAEMAFLIMTAQNKYADGTLHASNNVIHEIGLFQGKLGFKKAIILLEEGCQEFSNIHGLVQIRFPKGNIEAVFEKIREVLEREGVI